HPTFAFGVDNPFPLQNSGSHDPLHGTQVRARSPLRRGCGVTGGPIVVTGATGHVGCPLVALLVDAGVQVRAVSRNPAGAQLPDGVQVTDSVHEALRGASAVFLNSRALASDLQRVITGAR